MVHRPATTTIDLTTETLLTLHGAAKYVSGRFHPGEKSLHVSTLHRWTGKGIRGVRLETVCVGGAKGTSIQAIQRFFARLAGNETAEPATALAPAGSPPPVAGSADRERRAAAAEKILDAAGV